MATKRPNPFSEEIPRQRKFHVGLKELAREEDKEKMFGKKLTVINVKLMDNIM